MVRIEVDDEVWRVYRQSWALLGIRTDEQLIKLLEMQLMEESASVVEDAETELIDDTPEAYVQRQIGLLKQAHTRFL